MERTKQQNLNALVEKRIAEKLAKGKDNVQIATSRLMDEYQIAKDFIFDVGTEKKGIEKAINFKPDPSGAVGSTFYIPRRDDEGHLIKRNGATIIDPVDYRIHTNALRQVTQRLGIPGAYITDLLYGQEWQRTLGYEIMNTHNGWTDRNRMLVRSVGKEVRAFLSDQYRRLDSEMIFSTHIDAIHSAGGKLSDGYMSDTRMLIESIYPKPIEIVTEMNGIIMIAFGTRLISSDYGHGALDLRSFILQGVCLNGLVRESVLREIHLGAKLPDNLALSQRTYQLDSMTTASAVKDLTSNLYSSDVIKDRMLEIKAATEITVDANQMLTDLRGLNKLMKGECDEIGKILMRNNPRDGVQGESTLWKLSQGITAYANSEDVDQERRIDLQEIAGELFKKVNKN